MFDEALAVAQHQSAGLFPGVKHTMLEQARAEQTLLYLLSLSLLFGCGRAGLHQLHSEPGAQQGDSCSQALRT